jgi:hypothetical protein
VGRSFGFGFTGGGCVHQFLGNVPESFLLCRVAKISAGELVANHSFAINEGDVGDEGAHYRADLHEFQGGQLVYFADWKSRLELADERRNVGVGIEGAFQYLKTFGAKLFYKATQNLSGFLAVRSTGEDECQAQHLALVAGHQHLFAIRKVHGKLGRLAWKVGGEGGAEKRQRGENLRRHGGNLSIASLRGARVSAVPPISYN